MSAEPAFDALLDLAHAMADRAGEAIRPHFRRGSAVDDKSTGGGFDPVTVADRDAETAMRTLLAARAPGHAITGEEHGETAGTGRYRWVLDPIDGTRGFISGVLTWGTLIGLLEDGASVLGMMDQPWVRERFWSGRDASWMRAPDGSVTRLTTRPCADLEQAFLATTTPSTFNGCELDTYRAIEQRVRSTRYGTDCYAYCMVAAGQIDVVIEARLKPYDVVALIPIVERAGGIMTTWDGGPATNGGRIVAAGDRRLHSAVVEMLSQVPE